jgi:hypothetical protein
MIDWLIRRAQRTPYYDLPGYMRRWWLVPYRVVITRAGGQTDGTGPVSGFRPIARLLQAFDIAIRVHEILRSDADRHPHDHPWPYLTVILRGGYWESRYNAEGFLLHKRWHGPGSIMFRPANSWHRLDVPEDATATTLFITGKKCQTWGFRTEAGKVPYYEYLA